MKTRRGAKPCNNRAIIAPLCYTDLSGTTDITKPPTNVEGFVKREEDGRVSKTGEAAIADWGRECTGTSRAGRDVRLSACSVHKCMIAQQCIFYVN